MSQLAHARVRFAGDGLSVVRFPFAFPTPSLLLRPGRGPPALHHPLTESRARRFTGRSRAKGKYMNTRRQLGLPALTQGMGGFTTIWIGQFVSLLGSAMTRFAISVWAWQTTGQATSLALIGFFSFAPTVLLAPLAGVLIDRHSRKLVLILSDAAAAVSTLALLILHSRGALEIWHLYAAGIFASAFEAFQLPAFIASISMMVDRRQYARANAMQSSNRFASSLAAPVLAGALLVTIGLRGILLIDLLTFSVAMGTLAIVRIPRPERSDAGKRTRLWDQVREGLTYVRTHRSLIGVIALLFLLNLPGSAAMITFSAMILARTGNDKVILGIVQSIMGAGGVVGGVVVAAWGVRVHRRMQAVLWLRGIRRVAAFLILAVARTPVLWSIGAFFATFFAVAATSVNTSMLQAKVPNKLQGRFFSVYRVVGQATIPLGFLMAGPLVDRVLEPAMAADTGLARALGPVVGTGPGAGMAVLFLATAVLGVLTCLGATLVRPIREIDRLLPDRPTDEGE